MTQPRKEQINILRTEWSIFTYTATANTTSTTISASSLQAASVTGASGGNPATSPPTRGIVTTGSGGFVKLRLVSSALSLDDSGSQIFGRLTFVGGNYLLTYKKIVSGSEVSATLPGSSTYSVQMMFQEVMVFGEIPAGSDTIFGTNLELLPSGNTIAGDLVVNGNTTLGDSSSDTITTNARFITDLVPNPDNTVSLGSSALRFANGNFTQYTARADNTNTIKSIFNGTGITATGTSFSIDGNNSIQIGPSTATAVILGRSGITTSVVGTFNPTQNMVVGGLITVNGSGSPSVFNGDVNIVGTLTVGTILFVDLSVSGNTVLGDDVTTDTVNFQAKMISSILPKTSDLYDVGHSDARFHHIHGTTFFAHADDTNTNYVMLQDDTLLSSASFDVDGYSTLFIGATHATAVNIGRIGVTTTVDGYMTIDNGSQLNTTGSGTINLPNNINSRFLIENLSVGSTVTAPNVNTLTNGSNADALHTHAIGGGGAYNTTSTKTSLYTAVLQDLVVCDPTSSGFTVLLPTAVGQINKSIIIKNNSASTNTITVDAFGSETIDGSLTVNISIAYQSITFVSNDSNWMVV